MNGAKESDEYDYSRLDRLDGMPRNADYYAPVNARMAALVTESRARAAARDDNPLLTTKEAAVLTVGVVLLIASLVAVALVGIWLRSR